MLKQQDSLEEEDLHWLSARGANMKAGTARHQPLIQDMEGKNVITQEQACEEYNFVKSIIVYNSPCMTNVCDVEDAIQSFLPNEWTIDPHQNYDDNISKVGLKPGCRKGSKEIECGSWPL